MVRFRVLFGVMLGTGLMGLGIGYEIGQRSSSVEKDGSGSAPVCSMNNSPVSFGYSEEAPQDSHHWKTIRVPDFKVEHTQANLAGKIDRELTEEVVRAIVEKTPYKAGGTGDADMEMTGIIKDFHLQFPSGYLDARNDVREIETYLVVQLTWKDMRTGESLLAPKNGCRPSLFSGRQMVGIGRQAKRNRRQGQSNPRVGRGHASRGSFLAGGS